MIEPVLRIRHPQGLKLRPPVVPASMSAATDKQWPNRPLAKSLGLTCSLLALEAQAPTELDAIPFLSERDRKHRLFAIAQSFLSDKPRAVKDRFRPVVLGIAAMSATVDAADFSTGVKASCRFEENVRVISVKPDRPDQSNPRVTA